MSTLTGKQLESFPGFSEFPPVVRKLIWERALPDGRVVNLRSYNPLVLPEVEEDEVEDAKEIEDNENNEGSEDGQGNEHGEEKPFQVKDELYEDLHLPIALFINTESRNVALSKYFVLPAVHHDDSTIKPIPYVFSPSRDIAKAPFSFALNLQGLYSWNEHCWLAGLPSSELHRCLDQIEDLRVELAGDHAYFYGDNATCIRDHRTFNNSPDKGNKSYCCIFHKFFALKNVTFTMDHTDDPGLALIWDRTKFCLDMQEAIAHHIDSFQTGMTPDFILDSIGPSGMAWKEEFDGGLTMEEIKKAHLALGEDLIFDDDESDDEGMQTHDVGGGNMIFLIGGGGGSDSDGDGSSEEEGEEENSQETIEENTEEPTEEPTEVTTADTIDETTEEITEEMTEDVAEDVTEEIAEITHK